MQSPNYPINTTFGSGNKRPVLEDGTNISTVFSAPATSMTVAAIAFPNGGTISFFGTAVAISSLALGGGSIGSNALAVLGSSSFAGTTVVAGFLSQTGGLATSLSGNLGVAGISTLHAVTGTTLALGGASIGGNALAVTGTSSLAGAVLLGAGLTVTGSVIQTGGLASSFSGNVTISGNATIGGTLTSTWTRGSTAFSSTIPAGLNYTPSSSVSVTPGATITAYPAYSTGPTAGIAFHAYLSASNVLGFDFANNSGSSQTIAGTIYYDIIAH